MIPKKFLAEYACEVCGEVYVMDNCLVPWFSTYCDECVAVQVFRSVRIKHTSWEWDTVED